ncbi:hypothetical protein M5689_017654 [Euphorbia peplus]|nr:hypothetical protein M5689_017654 [Euphorbia peplus]
MFGGGKGMGGGAGGGRVLKVLSKSVARAGVTNLTETISSSASSSAASGSATSPTSISRSKHRFSNSSNNSVLTLSSASGSPFNAPVSANNGGPNATSWPYFPSVTCDSSSDDYEWISVDGSDEERTVGGAYDDTFLGPVPSLDEVQGAVSALTQIFDASAYSQFVSDRFAYDEDTDGADQISSPPGILRRVSPAGSDLDWVEPSPHLCNSRMLHPYGPDRVYDAFHLLQTEPAIQRMVISLSSDKAVWNAVLNNDVVRQLRDSYNSESVTSPSSESSEEEASEDSNPAMNVAKWIFENTKAKFMEVIENISNLLNELFKAPDDEKKANQTVDSFEDKLRTSFLLSVVVLLVVVVSRANTA